MLAAGIGSVASAGEPPLPLAVPACVEPGPDRSLPPLVARGPVLLASGEIRGNTPWVLPQLRVYVDAQFIPERVGSTRGYTQAIFGAALLPDVDRDGVNPENTVETHLPGSLRIQQYEVTVAAPRTVGGAAVYAARVIDVGCAHMQQQAPLRRGESRLVWVSTQAVDTFAFRAGPWYAVGNVEETQLTVSSGMEPNAIRDPHHGTDGKPLSFAWLRFSAWERLAGGLPVWQEVMTDGLVVGKKLELKDHVVEIVKVVHGPDTTLIDHEPWTTGDVPQVSVLAKVTRKRGSNR